MFGFWGKPKTEEGSPSISRRNARALRMIYCDERGEFRMDPDAVAALQVIKGPLGVVSVCGRARQGKSFILNQLVGKTNGFQVASTHRPCTKGLWMWSTPLKQIAADGTEYNVLLLDSEGIDAYDQTGTYSAQIFSLAVLLSSMFVYNQMGGIDEVSLDRLSLVTEMTKRIRVRASQNQSSAAELGKFSPVFLWLLRDFYLELSEDGHRITPREYLESALQNVPGDGNAVAGKNEVREAIRALFPDRECFALVRPINDERDLQKLDKIPIDKMRAEFRSGLETLTQLILERAKPKQLGSTIMTGPLLAGLTQSFLDALNSGAVPTISTSWQTVEETECRRARDAAFETYINFFENVPVHNEVKLLEAHEMAVQGAIEVYDKEAFGLGTSRHKHEKLLLTDLKKRFEDHKYKATIETELQCVKAVECMDEKLRAACHSADANLDQILENVGGMLQEYEESTSGSTKWKVLAKFLQQSFEGPILDFIKKRENQSTADTSALHLKCVTLEERLSLLEKQLSLSRREVQDWKERYDKVASEHKSFSEEYLDRCNKLQQHCISLEENSATMSYQLEALRSESSDWQSRYNQLLSTQKLDEDHVLDEAVSWRARCETAEARLDAAREQAASTKEEASEWKRKYEAFRDESMNCMTRNDAMRNLLLKQSQEQEDLLRAEFSSAMAMKERELNNAYDRMEKAELRVTNLSARLKEEESERLKREEEVSALKVELKRLQDLTDAGKTLLSSMSEELQMLKQEKVQSEQKLGEEVMKLKYMEQRCRELETDSKCASVTAQETALAAENHRVEVERLAEERLARIECLERHIEELTCAKDMMFDDLEKAISSEQDALQKVAAYEKRLDETQKEMEALLQSSNDQRTNTVHVLESLLDAERRAHAEAHERAEILSIQLQNTQGKLDALQEELSAVRLNEAALETKLKTVSADPSAGRFSLRSKRLRTDGSIQEMEQGAGNNEMFNPSQSYVSHSEASLMFPEVQSGENNNITGQQEYLKYTVSRLKQELTEAGHAEELLQLRNHSKKEVLSLYEKLIIRKQ